MCSPDPNSQKIRELLPDYLLFWSISTAGINQHSSLEVSSTLWFIAAEVLLQRQAFAFLLSWCSYREKWAIHPMETGSSNSNLWENSYFYLSFCFHPPLLTATSHQTNPLTDGLPHPSLSMQIQPLLYLSVSSCLVWTTQVLRHGWKNWWAL